MKDFTLEHFVGVIFGAIIAGMGFLTKKVHRLINDQKSQRQGLQALLRNQIISCYDKYSEREWIPIYAMENVLSMYDAYHGLGGNGTITKLIDELKELPSKEHKD